MSDARPAADFADIDRLREPLTRHHAHAGGDWRAACSLWSQLYFQTLVVPGVAFNLIAGEPVSLRLADLGVVLCPDRGAPTAFVRPSSPTPPDPADALAALVDDHLAAVIPALSRAGQLSQRLLWENAAWPLAFVLKEVIERCPARALVVVAFLGRPATHSALRSALVLVQRAALDEMPFERRLCCMRDRIPGLSRCAGQCPRRPKL